MVRFAPFFSATLLIAACAALPPSPEDDYQRALTVALANPRCPPAEVAAVFVAYERWFRTPEAAQSAEAAADVLVAQGEAFRAIGCDAAARLSFEEVLGRFPDPTLQRQREQALEELETLPPPYPLARPPIRQI